jgi:plastocyanin
MMGNATATQDNPTMKPASTTEAVPSAPVMKPVDEKEVYVTIEMSENGFKPDRVRVKKNTIVQFKNVGRTNMWPASNPHPSHTDYQDFDARRMVKPGETYEFRFKNVGTWGCHDHLSPGLSCRILVEE